MLAALWGSGNREGKMARWRDVKLLPDERLKGQAPVISSHLCGLESGDGKLFLERKRRVRFKEA